MTIRTVARRAFTVLALLLCCLVTCSGMLAATGIDFRLNPSLSVLYCALPILSLPLCLLSLVMRRLALIQAVLAATFVPVYSALIWRTCSELGTCGGIASVVLITLKAPQAITFIGVAICSWAAIALDNRATPRRNANS